MGSGSEFEYKFRYKRREGGAAAGEPLVGEDDLSEDQLEAYREINHWIRRPLGNLLTLGGYAGTGKSTLVSLLAFSYPDRQIGFCAYTGKAAGGLRQKIFTGATHRHSVSTIHRLIYTPVVDPKTGEVKSWKRREPDELPVDLIVVDEASMLDAEVYQDLRLFDRPILAVGDHGQLPPVMGDFNLVESPDLRLERIHRQAAHHPIIQLSAYIRERGDLPNGLPQGEQIRYIARSQLPQLIENIYGPKDARLQDVAILCYTNRTRQEMNDLVRRVRFPGSTLQGGPLPGEQILCLRNMAETVFNGMRGTLTRLARFPRNEHAYKVLVDFPDDELEFEGPALVHQFGQPQTFKSFEELERFGMKGVKEWRDTGLLLDYGYALTVHKAQGSQFECVILIYERPRGSSDEDFKRWLYTGTTRCVDMLFVVLPD